MSGAEHINIENPKITVAVVTYNSEGFLRIAIESILNSSYQNFELLISDDNSQDGSWEIINSYGDSRIKKFRNITNLGEYPNRNRCIDLATGKYLIFIDGDDYIYPHGLEYLVSCLKGVKNVGMVLGHAWKEDIIFPFLVNPVDFYRAHFLSQSSLVALNFTKILFNVDLLRKEGGLNNRYRTGDTYIQGLLGKKYPVLLVNEGFSWWRRRPDQASERILKDGTATAESFKYFMEFLNCEDCPLKGNELELGRINHYGNFARLLLRVLLKGKFHDFNRLIRVSKFPVNGWAWAVKPSKRNFQLQNVK